MSKVTNDKPGTCRRRDNVNVGRDAGATALNLQYLGTPLSRQEIER